MCKDIAKITYTVCLALHCCELLDIIITTASVCAFCGALVGYNVNINRMKNKVYHSPMAMQYTSDLSIAFQYFEAYFIKSKIKFQCVTTSLGMQLTTRQRSLRISFQAVCLYLLMQLTFTNANFTGQSDLSSFLIIRIACDFLKLFFFALNWLSNDFTMKFMMWRKHQNLGDDDQSSCRSSSTFANTLAILILHCYTLCFPSCSKCTQNVINAWWLGDVQASIALTLSILAMQLHVQVKTSHTSCETVEHEGLKSSVLNNRKWLKTLGCPMHNLSPM
ncbi:hypothetical protein J3A83DRAFT_4188303 [Scleroderma citrinum]